MKTEKWMSAAVLSAALLLLGATSCGPDWGDVDPPAGNQTYPTLEMVASYAFDSEEELDPIVINLQPYDGAEQPTLIEDDMVESNVLDLSNGYARFNNPLAEASVQNAVSLTFWMKQISAPALDEEGNEIEGEYQPQDLVSPIFHWENENTSSTLNFSANGWWNYDGVDGEWSENDPAEYATGYITPNEWHYVALLLRNDGYAIYVDGQKKVDQPVVDFDVTKAVQLAHNSDYLYVNYGADTHTSLLIEDLSFYRNVIESKQIARPKKGKIGNAGGGGGSTVTAEPIAPVFFNSFDAGMKGCSIVGGGEIKYVGGVWGNVFSNAMDGMRQNYLKLPSSALSPVGDTGEMTINVWINQGNETDPGHYMWSPLFSAYGSEPAGGENGTPMFICQFRGTVQVNTEYPNNGNEYCDYGANLSDTGEVIEYHDRWWDGIELDWIKDGGWHMYTITVNANKTIVYMDGEIANSWTLDGVTKGQICLMSGIAQLSYICLGGNQAWNWGDPDPGFYFDDLAIYDKVLSQDQIKAIMGLKADAIYANTFSNGADNATLVGEGTFLDSTTEGFGKYFKNAVGGMRQNYLKLPATTLNPIGSTGEMTINMWLNSTDAGDYYWNPVFTAFGSDAGGDGNPMFAWQYRGVISVNTEVPDNTGAEYCDYGDELHDNGKVILYHGDLDWLADKQWHMYTVTVTANRAIVYMDGEVANAWTIDGVSRGQICNMTAISQLKTICVVGNQAWWWGDPDPGFGVDDVIIYNKVLSQDEIKQLMLMKK